MKHRPHVTVAGSLAAEWLWLALVLSVLVAAASAGQWLQRLDRVAYDLALHTWRRPPPADIVIVAIDQESLDAIGRWPWSRALHAALLDRLAKAKPAAILLDLILPEPDEADPASDAALAAAMRRAGNVTLPVYADMLRNGNARLLAPHDGLAAAAAALGHIHLELDADGVARRVYLQERGDGFVLPHLAAATLEVARARGMGNGGGAASAASAASAAGASGAATPAPAALGAPADALFLRKDFRSPLQHDSELLIPFGGPTGHVRRVSYAAVLRGEVDAQELAGRVLLIGATAPGLGDSYPTPLSGGGLPMPGVEINANVIDALQHKTLLRELGPVASAFCSVSLLWLLLVSLAVLSPRAALLATLLTSAGGVLAALALLGLGGLWFAPSAAVFGLFLAYPLWSWRRLEAAARFLDAELAQHDHDAGLAQALLPVGAVAASPALEGRGHWQDVFARRIGQAHGAAAVLRQTRTVFAQSLAGLPMAVVVCDRQHQVFLANEAARGLLVPGDGGRLDAVPADRPLPLPTPLPNLLAELQRAGQPVDRGTAPSAPAHWRRLLDQTLDDGAAATVPLADGSGRAWLVSIAAYARVDGHAVGAIVSLTEVTELQRLQREERDVVHFLSHDLRSPQNAVLSLVDLARARSPAEPMAGLLLRIGQHAERSLALIDAILMQQRADRLDPNAFAPVDLAQCVHEVADQLWPVTQARKQQLSVIGADASAWVRGNGELLRRAIANLAVNASNYSGQGAQLELALRQDGKHWLCSMRDNGPGVPAQYLPLLFGRHFRVPPEPGATAAACKPAACRTSPPPLP